MFMHSKETFHSEPVGSGCQEAGALVFWASSHNPCITAHEGVIELHMKKLPAAKIRDF